MIFDYSINVISIVLLYLHNYYDNITKYLSTGNTVIRYYVKLLYYNSIEL